MNYVEIYVPQSVLETVVRAAAWYRDHGCDDDNLILKVDDAIKAIQDAADDDFSPERLDTNPLA